MEQPPYQQRYAPSPARPTSGLAIASLVLSILGFIQILPLIGSIIGLILGYMAKGAIAESQGMVGGDGLDKGGIIIAWVTLGLYVIGGCLVVLIAVVLPILGLGGLSICAGLEGIQ